MFSAIANYWREARSGRLKFEVVDALDKLSRTDVQVRAICATTFLDALATVQHDFGPTHSLSQDQLRHFAEKFNAAGRQTFDKNVGGSYGLFLFSAYLEASALSGHDAKAVLDLVTQYHRQAQAIHFAARRDD